MSLCPSMSSCPYATVLLNVPRFPHHCAPPCPHISMPIHVTMPLCHCVLPWPHITVPPPCPHVPMSLCPSMSPCPRAPPCPHVPTSLCPSMSHTVCPALPCASSRTGPQHPHAVPTSATTEQIPILGPLFSTPPPLTAILGTASPHRRRCGDAPRALPWGQRCPQHRGGGAGGPPPLSHCLQLPQVQVHPR